MNLARRVSVNMLFKYAGEGVTRTLAFAFYVVVARILDEGQFGLYNVVYGFAALLTVTGDMGISSLVVRNMARHPEKLPLDIGRISLLKLLLVTGYVALTTGAATIAYMAGRINPETGTAAIAFMTERISAEHVSLIALMSVFLVGVSCLDFCGAVSASQNRFDIEALYRGVWRVLILVMAIVALRVSPTVRTLLTAMIAASVVGLALATTLVSRLAPVWRLKWDPAYWRKFLGQSWPVGLGTLFFVIYFRVDIPMLKMMGQPEPSIGHYASAVKLAETVMVIIALFVTSMIPVLARVHATDLVRFQRLRDLAIRYLTVLGAPIAIGLGTLAWPIQSLVFGTKHLAGGTPLAILSAMVFFSFLSYVQTTILLVIGWQRKNLISSITCACVNIGCNFLLIPRFGILGCAVAKVITAMVMFSMSYMWLRRAGEAPRIVQEATPPLAAALVMAVLLRTLITHAPGLNLAVLVPTGALMYAAALLTFGGINKADLTTLSAAWRGGGKTS